MDALNERIEELDIMRSDIDRIIDDHHKQIEDLKQASAALAYEAYQLKTEEKSCFLLPLFAAVPPHPRSKPADRNTEAQLANQSPTQQGRQ